MKKYQGPVAIFACVLATSACAQSSPQPLDLKLPAEKTAAVASDETPATVPATVTDASAPADPANRGPIRPGMYYPDPNPRNRANAGSPGCDDSTYNQAHVDGSVSAGVVGGNHVSGNYQTAVIGVSKALGSCDSPAGDVGVSIGVSKGRFNDSRRWQH